MFTRRSKIKDLEQQVEIHKTEIKRMCERIVQLECPHTRISYSLNTGATIEDIINGNYLRHQHGKDYHKFCEDCGKCMGGISKEQKHKEELEAAREAYDRLKGE